LENNLKRGDNPTKYKIKIRINILHTSKFTINLKFKWRFKNRKKIKENKKEKIKEIGKRPLGPISCLDPPNLLSAQPKPTPAPAGGARSSVKQRNSSNRPLSADKQDRGRNHKLVGPRV
jgi:hypothetical protein